MHIYWSYFFPFLSNTIDPFSRLFFVFPMLTSRGTSLCSQNQETLEFGKSEGGEDSVGTGDGYGLLLLEL